MKKLQKLTAALLSVCMLCACGTGTADTSSKERTAAKEYANDFSGKLREFTVGNYVFQAPESWEYNDPYFYPERGSGSEFAMLYPIFSEAEGFNDDLLEPGADSFLEGYLGGLDSGEVLVKKTKYMSGKKMMYAEVDNEISGRKGITYLYWFANPVTEGISALLFFQGEDTKKDYTKDFDQIVKSLKQTESAAETKQEETPKDGDSEPKESVPPQEEVPKEYTSALRKAQSYNEIMHMSKQALYDQLTSEYADKFTAEAAQYAIDHLDADWNSNALKSAENYSDMMHMSKAAIYDQLVSEYGGQFTAEEAQYAIDNIQADWNHNALESAKSYRDLMDMSPAAIYDQLVSDYGGQFEASEAQYAIDHLDD